MSPVARNFGYALWVIVITWTAVWALAIYGVYRWVSMINARGQ